MDYILLTPPLWNIDNSLEIKSHFLDCVTERIMFLIIACKLMQIGNNMLLDAITWRDIPPIMFVPSIIARSFSLFHTIVIQTVYHSHGELFSI